MTTTPELLALGDACTRIEGAGIAYMLTGSLAMAYYARPRMTRDIDLVVELAADAVGALANALGPDYHFDEEAMREAVRNEQPCNAIHLPAMVKIDLIPRKSSDYRRTEFERRQRVDFAGIEVWIVSREDLILSKLDWARDTRSEMQLRDVRALLEGPLDRGYLVQIKAPTKFGVGHHRAKADELHDNTSQIAPFTCRNCIRSADPDSCAAIQGLADWLSW